MIHDRRRPLARIILAMSSLATIALISGCASVLTPVPESNYNELESHHTYYVVTKSGDTRQTAQQSIDDSVLVIEKPRAALHDARSYPVRIPFDDIESISTIKTESLLYIESGIEAGNRSGAETYSDSPFLITTELGHITGERVGRVHPRWGYGGTVYFGANADEFIGGIKARVRYRAGDHYSFDAAAGHSSASIMGSSVPWGSTSVVCSRSSPSGCNSTSSRGLNRTDTK